MPFIPIKSNISGVELGAWKITEEEFYFLERVKLYENEWKRLAEVIHPQKRLEWLASRLCLKEILHISNSNRVESLNLVSGKPYLSDHSHYISYTHSDPYAAAVASLDYEVGIDIEYLNRRRNPATRRKFMNSLELAVYEANPCFELFALIWSAKETLYKIYGEGINFKQNMMLEIENFELKPNGILTGIVQKNDWSKRYEISYTIHPEFLLTYTCNRLW